MTFVEVVEIEKIEPERKNTAISAPTTMGNIGRCPKVQQESENVETWKNTEWKQKSISASPLGCPDQDIQQAGVFPRRRNGAAIRCCPIGDQAITSSSIDSVMPAGFRLNDSRKSTALDAWEAALKMNLESPAIPFNQCLR